MTFTAGLWQSIAPIYDAILAHPFIQELTDGSLSRERFAFYMKQDALYLQDFSRTLATIGARAPQPAHQESFVGYANNVIVVERALHETYFREFGVTLDVDKAPACFAYTSHLLATSASGSYPEAVAAVLPCFWIYREVGHEIISRAESGINANPYRRWIETYAGGEFDAGVRRAIAIAEDVGSTATKDDQSRMRRAFEYSSRLEWMFWDSAYRLEPWPPLRP
jgi:thiaminase/transcriptional activator TenA